MEKWETVRYFIDCKKDIDSIMFMAQNVRLVSNLNLKGILDDRLREFYVKIKVVYDKSLSAQKIRELKDSDNIFERTLYERDKYYAHKDDNYIPNELEFNELISTLKEQLEHCQQLCNNTILGKISIDYVVYDRDLYRFVHKISPEDEEQILEARHPKYTKVTNEILGEYVKSFSDIDSIKMIKNPYQNGIIPLRAITDEEKCQMLQDTCIRTNLNLGTEYWVSFIKKK